MARQVILSDENCGGQAEAIFEALQRLSFVDLLGLELITSTQAGLGEGTDDETIWRFCQEHRYILLTGNRTAKDKADSLELTIRHLVTAASLPVLTIGNLRRVLRDRVYCERCAARLAEIVFDLDSYLGVTRLFLS